MTSIARLSVDLGLEPGEFIDGAQRAQGAFSRFAREIGDQFEALSRNIRRVGVGLTAGITAPFAALTVVSRRTAGDFQSAMNNVHAALRGIDPAQLEQLNALARRLGPEVGRSAIEAANGIETLALAGLSADQILRGAAESTLRLAAANDAQLTPSAAALTDVMEQFGLVTSDLPRVVDQITGALDASKLSFEDFQQAISQAGGVAGNLGVSFEDFNTAIAATAPLFASGSDAGTSFKTFLQRLVPQSTDATRVMEQLGLQFFDAENRMKSLADIAEELRTKMGNLSERSMTEAMTVLFGADAMRTAIGLMNTGRERFEALQETIGRTDAGEKLAIQLSGLEAAGNRTAAAFEQLKIALGEAGLLTIFTGLAGATAAVIGAFANLPQPVLTAGIAIGALAAAIGPLTLAVLAIGRVALPLFIGRMGLAGIAITALINPIGALAGLFLNLAVRLTGASSALSLFAAGLARVLGPLGLVATVLTVLYLGLNRQVQATAATTAATDALSRSTAAYEEAARAAAAATGETRRQALASAAAKREEARQIIATTIALQQEALARFRAAQAAAVLNQQRMRVAAQDPRLIPGAGPRVAGDQIEQEAANMEALTASIREASASFRNADAVLRAAASAGGGTVSPNFAAPDRERSSRGRSARDQREQALREEAEHLSEMRRFRMDLLRSAQDQTTDAVVRSQLEEQILDIEREEYAAQLRLQVALGDLTEARAQQRLAAYEGLDEERRHTLLITRAREVADENRQIDQARHDIQVDALRHESSMADTASERRGIELRLLDIAYRYERARLQELATAEGLNRVERERAQLAVNDLDARHARERQSVMRATQGPVESFLAQLPTTAERANEALQRLAVDGLKSIEDGLVAALMGTKSLAAAFRDMASSIISDLLRIQIQRMITIPLANMLGGLTPGMGGVPGMGAQTTQVQTAVKGATDALSKMATAAHGSTEALGQQALGLGNFGQALGLALAGIISAAGQGLGSGKPGTGPLGAIGSIIKGENVFKSILGNFMTGMQVLGATKGGDFTKLLGGGGKIPGLAGGGMIRVRGMPGIDRNMLALNGVPVARVNKGEDISVSPRGKFGGPMIGNLYITAPNTGDARRDRRTSLQQAADVRREIGRATRRGM